jgi:hypothetical protein
MGYAGQDSHLSDNGTKSLCRKKSHYECKDLPGNQYCELCIEIDYNEPQITAFESVDVSPEFRTNTSEFIRTLKFP